MCYLSKNNQISDLSPLRRLKHLQFLDLSHNRVRHLDSLSGLEFLEALNLINNQVSDLKPIEKLPLLKVLLAQGNQIASISGLKKLLIVKLERQHIQWEIEGDNLSCLDLRGRITDINGTVPMICVDPKMGSYDPRSKIVSIPEGKTHLTLGFEGECEDVPFSGTIDCVLKPKVKE